MMGRTLRLLPLLPLLPLLVGCGLSFQHARTDAAACTARGLTPGTEAFARCRQAIEEQRARSRPAPDHDAAARRAL